MQNIVVKLVLKPMCLHICKMMLILTTAFADATECVVSLFHGNLVTTVLNFFKSKYAPKTLSVDIRSRVMREKPPPRSKLIKITKKKALRLEAV